MFQTVSKKSFVFVRQKFAFEQTVKLNNITWVRKCCLRPIEAPKCTKQSVLGNFFVFFDWYTSKTSLYRTKISFSGKSNPSRLKTSSSHSQSKSHQNRQHRYFRINLQKLRFSDFWRGPTATSKHRDPIFCFEVPPWFTSPPNVIPQLEKKLRTGAGPLKLNY